MIDFERDRLLLEAATGGKTTLLRDDKERSSVMVRIPKFRLCDVIPGAGSAVHPAFVVGGKEIDEFYISKYDNVTEDGRAYSLPARDPRVDVTYDEAHELCRAKGQGWHLTTNAEWAAVALWSKRNGTMPHGNNLNGQDSRFTWEKGVPSSRYQDGETEKIGRVLTGTGPAAWSHTHGADGVWDMNGNVWNWVGGLRILDGEIQVIPDNDAVHADHSPGSSQWRGILADGSLAAPGTPGTLKYDGVENGRNDRIATRIGGICLNDRMENPLHTGGSTEEMFGYGTIPWEELTAKNGIAVPELLCALGLFPIDRQYDSDTLYVRNYGERLPFRGGGFVNAQGSGIFALNVENPRENRAHYRGFRSSFVQI